MRRIFVSLCALAIAVPVLAQEKMPAPTPASTSVTTTTSSTSKTGIFSRIFRGRNNTSEVAMPMTTTTMVSGNKTTTTMMEPMYNSRGRMMGYHAVEMHPAPMPTPVPSTITQTSGTDDKNAHNVTKGDRHTVTKSETKVVQTTPAIQTVSEPAPKRGLLARIFRK